MDKIDLLPGELNGGLAPSSERRSDFLSLLNIKRNGWLLQSTIAFYFEFQTALKLYNLGAWKKVRYSNSISITWKVILSPAKRPLSAGADQGFLEKGTDV